MPTGYTAKLHDGEQTFDEFFWNCARAIGLFVTMREDDIGTPIPTAFVPSKWHEEQLAQLENRKRGLEALTLANCDKRAKKEYEESLAEFEKSRKAQDVRLARFQQMREEVEAWRPPLPAYEDFKRFMLEQLDTEQPYAGEPPVLEDGKTWRDNRLEDVERSLSFHKREREAALRRIADRNRDLAALRKSVPPPPHLRDGGRRE